MTPKKLAPDFIFKDECYAIVGACFEVYKDKGCGFYEPVYQECLGIEFEHCRIPVIVQPGLSLEYRGRLLNQKYFPDFVCYVNFGHYPKLQYERIAKTRPKPESDETISL
jgi:PD-(D/E)XK nuclease superfamily protein